MMRKLLFTALLTLLTFFGSYAEIVTQKTAAKVAKNYFFETANAYYTSLTYQDISLELYTTKMKAGEPVYYMYNVVPEGFIIISADDLYNPVLGYSVTGQLEDPFKNANFADWMEEYEKAIINLRQDSFEQTPELQARWERYTNSDETALLNPEKSRDIPPLMTNLWNQDSPYNFMCPEDASGPGSHTYAGCVATAMSMIMYHYKYPEQGSGSNSYYFYPYGWISANFGETTYNWDAMMDEIMPSSPEQSIEAIAELQYHCGVAVDMQYSPDGSGAYSNDVPDAIKNYFGYSSSAQYLLKSYYTNVQWQNLIIDQLENNHPIYYSGQDDEGGHAFGLDGMQGADMFHFNFGWSGYQNGYYYLEGSGAVGGFNQNQGMVINFYPDNTQYPYACSSDTIASLGGTIDDKGYPNESYPVNASCSWLITRPTVMDSVSYYKLNFLMMDLEIGADHVTIYDGSTENAPLLGSYTGTTLPEEITTTNDTVLVIFTSDGNDDGSTGFRLQYEGETPMYCTAPVYLTEPEGTFDDGSGAMNYGYGSTCQFILEPTYATGITLYFDNFDLADGDLLRIYQTNPTLEIAELTNEDNPSPIHIETGSAIMFFATDNMYVSDGFTISYQIDNVGVTDTKFLSDFTVYPNPATDKMTVRVEAEDMAEVILKIHAMDGKIVTEKPLSRAGNGLFAEEISVDSFEKGVYLISIQSKDGISTKRIVIK